MGDDERGPLLDQPLNALLNQILGLRVNVGRGLVKHDDLRIVEQCPSDGEALPLAARELDTPLAYLRVVPVREVCDELVSRSGLSRPFYPAAGALIGSFRLLGLQYLAVAVRDILRNGPREQVRILLDDSDRVP